MRPLLVLALLPAAVALAAFAPPLPSPESAQQAPPKTWIPEPKEKAPPMEYHAYPLDPSGAAQSAPPTSFLHAAPGTACSAHESGPAKSTKLFAENYTAAKRALDSRDWNSALAFAEDAARAAKSGREWSGIEQLRIVALNGLGDSRSLIAVIEAALGLGCATPEQVRNLKEMQENARGRPAPQQ